MSVSTSSEPGDAPVVEQDSTEPIAYYLALQRSASNAYWKLFMVQVLALAGLGFPATSGIAVILLILTAAIFSYRPIKIIGSRKEWSEVTCRWVAICFGIHYPIFFVLGFGLIPMLVLRLGVVSGLRKEGIETFLLWYRKSDIEGSEGCSLQHRSETDTQSTIDGEDETPC
jgi:hypothetical protein